MFSRLLRQGDVGIEQDGLAEVQIDTGGRRFTHETLVFDFEPVLCAVSTVVRRAYQTKCMHGLNRIHSAESWKQIGQRSALSFSIAIIESRAVNTN